MKLLAETPNWRGIGIACPGPLDPFTGVIGDVGTLPGWQRGNLETELESEFNVQVAVENDADAAGPCGSELGKGEMQTALHLRHRKYGHWWHRSIVVISS